MPEPVDPARTNTDQEYPSAAGNLDETALAPSGHKLPRLAPPAELTVVGPYRILKQLGRGGMGAVYLALDTRLDRKVALKVMLPGFAVDADAKGRFLREGRAAAKVSHDNVVTIFEADERDGTPYIAMQFLQGYPLDEYLRTKGVPAFPHVIRIAREAALGLAAAHALGLVHRDIKPANLWLEAPNGRVKVLDFGLAKPAGSDIELTKSGAVIGTPAYMSPEQARSEKVDARTDLFSLGAVMYLLCTGKTPFAGPTMMAVLMALGSDDPTPVRELNPNVPEALAALIHQLLAKKAADRPQTAAEVAKRLRAMLEKLAAPPASASKAIPVEATPADLSTSLPVVVNPVPVQQPVVSQMHVTAQPESAFENLDAKNESESTHIEPTFDERSKPKPNPARKKSGGKGPLIAAGVAALLALVAGAVVIAMMNKGKPDPEVKAPEVPPGDKGSKPVPKVEPTPPKPADPFSPTFKNGTGMEFVPVPKAADGINGAPEKVAFDYDFYLGKFEVTQEEWEKLMGTNPSWFSRTGKSKDAAKDIKDADLKRFPVENVSWDDCQEFLKKLNEKEKEKETGWVYRLPTSAEWGYACRGGPVDKADTIFSFYFAQPTNALLLTQANFQTAAEAGLGRPCPVGSYPPNRLGLHDMHGNVWEWCHDTVQQQGTSYRTTTGGGWVNTSDAGHVENRYLSEPSSRNHHNGLRVARVPAGGAASVGAADPDRKAAEYVLSVGGKVMIENLQITAPAELPKEPFPLQTVMLGTNKQITDASLAVFKDCTNLKHLDLVGTPVTDAGLAHFKNCKQLSVVYLHNNTQITDAGLAHFKDCKTFGVLGLQGCTQVTDAGLAHFKGCAALYSLGLDNTPVTDVGLAHFKDCIDLRDLSLSETQVTDAGLDLFKERKKLTLLVLQKTKVSAAKVAELKKALPQCTIESDHKNP